MSDRHASRSWAALYHLSLSMSAFLSAFITPSPYVNCGAPLGRVLRTHDVSNFLGSLSWSIRATCSNHLNCLLFMYSYIERTFNRFSKSSVRILWSRVCNLVTRHIVRTHLAWKTRSLLNNFSVRHQVSDPYSNIERMSPT